MKLYIVADEGLDSIQFYAWLMDGFIEPGDEPNVASVEIERSAALAACRSDDPTLILEVYELDYDGSMTIGEIRMFFNC